MPAIRVKAVEAFAAAIAASDDPRPKKVVDLIERLAVQGMTPTDKWANLRLVKATGATITPDQAWYATSERLQTCPMTSVPNGGRSCPPASHSSAAPCSHNHRKQVVRWEGVGLAWDGPEPDDEGF